MDTSQIWAESVGEEDVVSVSVSMSVSAFFFLFLSFCC